MGEAERGDSIARAYVSYFCANGHEVRPSFAVEETVVIQLNGTALSVVIQPDAIAIIRLTQLKTSHIRLTLPT
jgi:hypothetical protein